MCIIEGTSSSLSSNLLGHPETARIQGRHSREFMTIINILQIIISVVLIAVILLQVKGQGTPLFGSGDSSFRTRRGLEKTLFQFTIFMVIVFIGMSIVSVRFF